MPTIVAEMTEQLELLRKRTLSDFAAVASRQGDGRCIRWICGSGCGNERYLHIRETIGHGIAGIVLRHGRPVVVRGSEPDAERTRRSYPILLAEHLQAAAAVPVAGDSLGMVLLIGRREPRDYSEDEMLLLEQAAAPCSDVCKCLQSGKL
ncbi:MAG: hypothetical protein K0Q59_4812 [Paenibacillus sp.]|jgi:nitrogen regulatory protein A|nr:hypothetical protein [Paenibacillus sp.]